MGFNMEDAIRHPPKAFLVENGLWILTQIEILTLSLNLTSAISK